MILSDKDLLELISNQIIEINPFSIKNLGPCSYDLTLGNKIISFRESFLIDIKQKWQDNKYLIQDIPEEGFVLFPRKFYLVSTKEWIKIPTNLCAFIEGRSSIGRLGLFIHNAGWIDSGFEGNITLELFVANHCPIKIYPDMRICQIIFAKLSSEVLRPYSGKYYKQIDVTTSKIFEDFNEKK